MNKIRIRIHHTWRINLSYYCAPVDLLFCRLNNYTHNLFTVHVVVYIRLKQNLQVVFNLIFFIIHLWVIGSYGIILLLLHAGRCDVLNIKCTRNRLHFERPTNVILRRRTVESEKKNLLWAFWNCEDDVSVCVIHDFDITLLFIIHLR